MPLMQIAAITLDEVVAAIVIVSQKRKQKLPKKMKAASSALEAAFNSQRSRFRGTLKAAS